MERCPACGGIIKEKIRFCPHCGAALPNGKETQPEDYWAKQIELAAENPCLEPENSGDDMGDTGCQETEKKTESGWKPPLEQRKKDRRIMVLAVILGIVLAVSAAVCQHFVYEAREVPGAGMYNGISTDYEDLNLDIREDWVHLKKDHTFRLHLMGGYVNGTWYLRGEDLTLEIRNQGGKDKLYPLIVRGKLKDCALNFSYNRISYRFVLEGHGAERMGASEEATEAAATEQMLSYENWAGEYYGWMGIHRCTGAWSGSDGAAQDVCCRITVDENDMGTVTLGNPGEKKGKRFCSAEVLFLPGTTNMGKMRVHWGRFQNMELRAGAWEVDPGKSSVSFLPHMLCIRGSFIDPKDPDSGFDYEIYLRPWGETWEDIRQVPSEDLPWTDMLPPDYENWYLPMIQRGMGMPDDF